MDFHRKSISIELTTFFFIDSYRVVSEIDINLRLISIAIDYYRLSVYRLTTPGFYLDSDSLPSLLRKNIVHIKLTWTVSSSLQ